MAIQVEYKSYYQWVPFVLFFQACLFYTPHALFKLSEGGKVEQKVHSESCKVESEATKLEKKPVEPVKATTLINLNQVSTVLQCLYQRSALLEDTNRLSEQKVRGVWIRFI